MKDFLEKRKIHKSRNLRTQVSFKANLKRNFSKITFQSRSSSERPTLSEKLKMKVRQLERELSLLKQKNKSTSLIINTITKETKQF